MILHYILKSLETLQSITKENLIKIKLPWNSKNYSQTKFKYKTCFFYSLTAHLCGTVACPRAPVHTSLACRETNVVVLWIPHRPPSRNCQSRLHTGQSICARKGWCGWRSVVEIEKTFHKGKQNTNWQLIL